MGTAFDDEGAFGRPTRILSPVFCIKGFPTRTSMMEKALHDHFVEIPATAEKYGVANLKKYGFVNILFDKAHPRRSRSSASVPIAWA